jgi:hypothetical protein
MAQEVVGVEDKGSSNTTKIEVQTLLEALLNRPPISTCFAEEAFFW